MTGSKVHYPLYRQLRGGGHLYCIKGADHFVELQRIGRRWVRHEVVADAYPEKVRIADMIADPEGRFLELPASEWEMALHNMTQR